jgi:hypothetical protein
MIAARRLLALVVTSIRAKMADDGTVRR